MAGKKKSKVWFDISCRIHGKKRQPKDDAQWIAVASNSFQTKRKRFNTECPTCRAERLKSQLPNAKAVGLAET